MSDITGYGKNDFGQAFMEKYIPKYWHFVDRSNDGHLNYAEFKMAWSDMAAIFVQVSFKISIKFFTQVLLFQLESVFMIFFFSVT